MFSKEQSLGYAVADLTGTIVEISAAYALAMGRHASEFVGREPAWVYYASNQLLAGIRRDTYD